MEFVCVPGGEYEMGNIFGRVHHPDELPEHRVRLDDFMMGRYPVTQLEWEKVMGNIPCDCEKGPRYPVYNVSWDDCQEFIQKLNDKTGKNFRLPTEAEWGYAARSGGKIKEWAGTSDESLLSKYAWYNENSAASTHPVGEKKPNGLGLYDMCGNVREWCNDWYDMVYYHDSPRNNPQGPSSGTGRIIRGGGWNDTPVKMRAVHRDVFWSDTRLDTLGFRLALPVELAVQI